MNSPVRSRPVDIADPQLSWQAVDSDFQAEACIHQWLQAPGSLTRLLKLASGGDFRVQVEQEGWQYLTSSALRGQFGPLDESHRFWSRRVRLLGQGQAWVQAHTLMPEHSLLSPLRQVLDLGSKPLGEFLFEHPDLIRGPHQVARHSDQTWGRRSLFFLFSKPIMVAEFFLPALAERPVPD